MDEDSAVQDALTSESVRAALKSLDPRYYDQHFMLQSPISHTDIPFGATSSSPGMTDIYHGSRTPTWYDLPPVSEVGFETGRTEANTLIGNKPYVYASTEPNVSKMLSEGEGRFGTYLKGEVPTESLRLGISTVPGAFGGDPRYPNYDPGKEEFIRSRGFDPKMAETEFLLTPENANRAFGFSPGDATVAPRARVGPFDLGQTAAQQAQGARIPLSAALKGISGAVLNTNPKGGEYIGSAKDFLPGLKQKAITGAGTAARFAGPLSIPIDLWAANQYFGEDAPARGLAALASTVFPPALAVEAGLNVGAGIQDAARQAGEYLTSPENPLPGIFPEGTPDLTGNVPLQQDIRAEDSALTDRFGDYVASRNVYEDVDVLDTTEELREQAENIYDAYSPEQQSQSAQALIRSFTENPEVAPLVSRKGDRRAAVEEALETYLPAAMGIYDDPAQFQEPLAEARKGIMDRLAARFGGGEGREELTWGDQLPVGVSATDYPYSSRGDLPWEAPLPVEGLRVPEYRGTAPTFRSNLIADQAVWDDAVANDKSVSDLADKHDVRRHLDAVFGTDSSGATDPTVGMAVRFGKKLEDFIVPNLPSDTDRDAFLKMHDNFGTVQGMVDKYQSSWGAYGDDNVPAAEEKEEVQRDLQEALKDLVNNQLFMGARDLGQSADEAYDNANVVFDEEKFEGLSEALVTEKANINQLDAALQLVRDAPEDERVVESFTKQGLMDIATQVESFATIPKVSKPKKKEVKKVKKGPTKEQKASTRKANQAANKKLLADKKEARDIQKAKNAAIRAEKLAAKESAKQASERKAAEKALAIQRVHEKMAREEELKRHEQMLRFAEESRQAYLARKKQEDELREAQGYGWGDMFT